MIWKIAKKEFLLNLMTFKFAVGTILCVVLMAVFMPVLLNDYQRRLKDYNANVTANEAELRKVKVYKNITPTIYRQPSVLSVFSGGLEKQLGSSAKIELDKVPEINAASAGDNPYLSVFSVFDASLIFKIVISVLALLVAYDVISGERQQGTLKLIMSGTVARHEILLGKLLAGLTTLAVPVTIAFIAGLLILLSFPMVDLSRSDWARIGLMYLTTLIFISAMYNIGLLFSCLARKSAISLVLGLFLWIVFVVVITNGSIYLATQIQPLESEIKTAGRIAVLQNSFKSELNKVKPKSSDGNQSDATGAFGHSYHYLLDKPGVEYRQKLFAVENPLKIKYSDKLWEVKRGYLNSLFRQKYLANNLSRISPISVYENVMSSLAGTNPKSFQSFMDNVRNYRIEMIEYIRSKTSNFSSPAYFTTCSMEDAAEYERLMGPLIEAYKAQNEEAMIATQTVLFNWLNDEKIKQTSFLDLEDFPRFIYQADVGRSVLWTLTDLGLLVFANVLFFGLSFIAFVRYDVRSD